MGDPIETINGVPAETLSGFLHEGVHARGITDNTSTLPFVAVGLTDTGQFDESAFHAAILQLPSEDEDPRRTKYIVQRLPGNDTGDVLYVFPKTTQHDGFYARLRRVHGYQGELKSAGFVDLTSHDGKPTATFSGASSSLMDRLSIMASYTYREQILAPKLASSRILFSVK